MTFAALLASLLPLDADVALVFEVDDHVIGAGYHVTELRHSHSTGIDCGGNTESWQEARLQLLDGQGTTHMSVGKFRAILEHSLKTIPKLSDVPLLAEFAPNNQGLKLMNIAEPILKDGRATIVMRNSKAICKPAYKTRAQNDNTADENVGSGCCGSAPSPDTRQVCCA